jgi:type IV pilus assembly protein PilA
LSEDVRSSIGFFSNILKILRKIKYFANFSLLACNLLQPFLQTACTGRVRILPVHVNNSMWRSIMTIQKKAQQGFTLIELMIVIAIVGILAAIALPAYQDYIVRSKLSEPLAALAEAKTTVAEYVAANGGFPNDPAGATAFGINTSSRLTTSDITNELDILPGTGLVEGSPVYIVARVFTSVWDGSTKADGATLSFQLSGSINSDGTMSWTCLPGEVDARGTDTAIPTKYLPANCRG